jgi:hypothetical protein
MKIKDRRIIFTTKAPAPKGGPVSTNQCGGSSPRKAFSEFLRIMNFTFLVSWCLGGEEMVGEILFL